jgi:hypothetical protein
MKEKKLIVFTNQASIKTFSPELFPKRIKEEFKNIGRLKEVGVMALTEKELIENYDELHDELFLVSDVIEPSEFKNFYESLPSKDYDIYILYHINRGQGGFDFKKMFEGNGITMDYKIKEGEHLGGNGTYEHFGLYWGDPSMGAKGLIDAIWKNLANDFKRNKTDFIACYLSNEKNDSFEKSKQFLERNIEDFADKFKLFEEVKGSPYIDPEKKEAFNTFQKWLDEAIK